jgi:hypothetical protein
MSERGDGNCVCVLFIERVLKGENELGLRHCEFVREIFGKSGEN